MRSFGRALLFALALPLCAPAAADAQSAAGPTPGVDPADTVHLIGPPLTALRTKIADPNWLVAWLLKPSHLRRRPLMRNFNLKQEDALILARYFYSGQAPASPSPPWRGGDARKGEALFVSRGCRACHVIAASEAIPGSRAPDLAGVGLKVRGEWLFRWLKSPREYDPDTAMPQLGLSDSEVRDLIAFLRSHREGADVLAAAPRYDPRIALDTASTIIDRFDCAKCHLLTAFQTVEPSHGWAVAPRSCNNCHDVSGSTRRPNPEPASGDANTIALRDGRRLVAYYGCRGCHRIEGQGGVIAEFIERKTFAPPALDAEGARVQPSWLTEFLQHPKPLRPWMALRMPNFDLSAPEAGALARYFAVLAHVPVTDEATESGAADIASLGRRRFTHFKCLQCHPVNAQTPLADGVDPEDLSINLLQTKTRLRPSWVREFLARPKTVVGTETRMPTVFYTTDGLPKVEQPERDIGAITTFLFAMSEATLDTAAPSATPSPIDWSLYPY